MANDRDCENCKHHREVRKNGKFYRFCESWDCGFEPKEDEEFEPKEDAISRQAVLKIIDGWYEQNRDTDNIEDLIVLITYMDSVNPQKPICPSAGVDCEDCPASSSEKPNINEVLDNIKAEIANHLKTMTICDVEKDNGVIVQSELTNRKIVLYDTVLQIIDNYKAEESGEE